MAVSDGAQFETGAAGVLNDPLFENFFAFPVSFINCLLTGTFIYIPLFVIGMLVNGNRYDRTIVKKSFEHISSMPSSINPVSLISGKDFPESSDVLSIFPSIYRKSYMFKKPSKAV